MFQFAKEHDIWIPHAKVVNGQISSSRSEVDSSTPAHLHSGYVQSDDSGFLQGANNIPIW